METNTAGLMTKCTDKVVLNRNWNWFEWFLLPFIFKYHPWVQSYCL